MKGDRHALTADLEAANNHIEFLQAELTKWQHAATHDLLTGVLNRRGLFDAAALLDPSGVFCVYVLDGNGIKALNDSAGHAAGDERLQQITVLISAPGCITARTGGDEFVSIRPLPSPSLASSALFAVAGALWMPDHEPLDAALRRADARMYQSKPQSTRPKVPAQRSHR